MASTTLSSTARMWATPVVKHLKKQNIHPGFHETPTSSGHGIEAVKLASADRVPIDLPDVAGTWWIRISWEFAVDPAGDEWVLEASSVSLNVSGLDFCGADGVCFVRYDVDTKRAGPGGQPLGRHLNVYQPEPLEDKIHFSIPLSDEEWDVVEVLEVLLSPEFFEDISSRLN